MSLDRVSRPQAVLLDLGGVVIDIDPRACFVSWASDAGVDIASVAARWAVDDAYKAFEVGAIDFDEYLTNLSRRLAITLTREQWFKGWNGLLRSPFADVARLLPTLAGTLPLYAFSNTNPVHQQAWQSRFKDALAPIKKIYSSWQIGLRKPTVQAYLKVAEEIGIAPAHILFVDDNRDNVIGARAAGMDARHVANEADTVAILRGLIRDG